MEKNSKKVISILMIAMALICVAIITGISLISTKLSVDKNQPANQLLADNSKLTSNQVIVQACKLLGTRYSFGVKGGDSYGSGAVYSLNYVQNNGIDCSGLIYWTLSSLGQRTQGFGLNNPVPSDTYHWLQYSNGQIRFYWSECGSQQGTGTKSAKATANAGGLTLNGNKIEVLKANDEIGELRYYEYGQKGQYLPAGTVVISNGKALAGRVLPDGSVVSANEVEDHAWITLGYLDTTEPEDVINYLVSIGVPRESLIAGTKDANGNITPSNANVVKESDSCKYWRIESTANNGLKGVYINNCDAEIGVSRYNVSEGRYVKKAVGPIWAFKVVEEDKQRTGDFQLSVFKSNENGQAMPLSSNIFKVTDISDPNNRHEVTGTISTTDSSKVELSKINLTGNDEGKKFTYLIEEREAPAGYEKYGNVIKVEITAGYVEAFDRVVGNVTGFWIGSDENNLVQQQIGKQGTFQYDNGKVDIQYYNGIINVHIKNTKITGNYKLNILKTDATGNSHLLGSDFQVKKANGEAVSIVKDSESLEWFTTNAIAINDVDSADIYEIVETNIPTGHIGLDKKILVKVNKAINGNKYVISSADVYVFDEDEDYDVSNLLEESKVGTINNENKVTNYDKNGKFFSVELSNNNSEINVRVSNKFIDLALKKTITKVGTEGNMKSVTLENGFNTGRNHSEVYGPEANLTNDGVDVTSLSNSTNATYYMNKKAVEVAVGDRVEYAIKIFNEGQVNAKASKIADYIPKGLRVVGVKYAGQDLTTYTYDETYGVLNIELPQADLINAFNLETKTLSKDEVTVICEVKDDATGVLTNVAEITEYMDENGVIATDVDSTSNNWTAPNGENKLNNTKDSRGWRTYNTNKNAADWSDSYLAQDTGLNENKGDDDDFDKVIVVKDEQVTLTLNKVNEDDNQGINDIYFNITKQVDRGEIQTQNDVQLDNAQFVDNQTISGIKTNKIVYTFEEVNNNNYIQLDGSIKLEVNTSAGSIVDYLVFYRRNDETNYTILTQNSILPGEKTFYLTASNGHKFTVKFNVTDKNINITIPNKPIQPAQYGLKLRKVSSSDGRGLAGVTFTGTDNGQAIGLNATDANGYTNEITKQITIDNCKTQDVYEISETNLGANAGFTALDKPITVTVTKELTQEGVLQVKNFVVKVGTTEETIDSRLTARNINVTDSNNVTYSINVKLENNVLNITVPNAPNKPVKLQLVKVNSVNNEAILGTGYSVYRYGTESLVYKGQDLTGVLDISDSVEAGTRTAEYEIYEDYAATGYVNSLAGKMVKLTVTFVDGVPQANSLEYKVLNSDRTEADAEFQDLASAEINGDTVKVTIKNAPVQNQIDLALKKVITKIDGHDVKANSTMSFPAEFERTTSGKERIDTTPLKNYRPNTTDRHDAAYYLNKTPILVLKGSKVTYEIRIYNEGEEDATASEITDYLAPHMRLDKVSYHGTTLTEGTDYTLDATTNTLKIKVLKDKDLIEKYDPTEDVLHMDYVTVECTVLDSAEGLLTNVAQISEYEMNYSGERKVVSEDVDSTSNNWKNNVTRKSENNETVDRTVGYWCNYTGELIGPRRNTVEDGAFKDYLGEEDDDDFEKVKVAEIDLVLKKVITKINNTEENRFGNGYTRFQEKDEDRDIITDVRAFNRVTGTTTAEYYLNKTPITVKVGDMVTYQIRIYNEGSIDATASEIKDYIPAGLTFDSIYLGDSEQPLTSGYSYNEETNVLTISALKNDYIEKYKGTALRLEDPSYKYVTVKCQVTGERKGLLTNVAEISKYQTIYGETNEDRDSQTTGDGEWQAPNGTDKNTMEGKSGSNWADYHNAIEEGQFENYPGQQDDDDFEKIRILGYNFKVHKYSDWNTSGLQGAKFEINGQEYTTDENGDIDLGFYPLTSDPTGAGIFSIKELEAAGHSILDDTLTVSFEKGNDPVITGVIMSYANREERGNIGSMTFWAAGERITLSSREDEDGIKNITLVIPNKHDLEYYDLVIRKVDNSNNGISGSKFDVTPTDIVLGEAATPWSYGVARSVTTGENGSVKIGRFTLNKAQWYTRIDDTKDVFIVEEQDISSDYYKIADDQDIYLTVNKNIVTDEEGNISKLSVQSIQLTLNKGKEGQVETEAGRKVTLTNVKLDKQGLTVDVTAEITEVMDEGLGKKVPTITITVPNIPKKFDLALRKYILNVENDKESIEVNRWADPAIEIEPLIENGTAKYNNAKDPIQVHMRDTVLYGISIYNEGEKDGYAQVVFDDVPEGVEMIAPGDGTEGTSKVNAEYRWVMYRLATESDTDVVTLDGVNYVETENASEAKVILTDYLSKEQGEARIPEGSTAVNPNLMKAFDAETMDTPMSRYVMVEFKVKTTNNEGDVITNKAQIIRHGDANGNTIELKDEDSTPGEWIDTDDDQDVEHLVVLRDKLYDLALRKFITDVNGEAIAESRVPTVDCLPLIQGEHDAIYSKELEPVVVKTNDIVGYTLRIFNEGKDDAYASLVVDDVPAGLEMVLPEYDEEGKPVNLNAEYGWKMFKEVEYNEFLSLNAENEIYQIDGKTYIRTNDAREANLITTEYLSNENGEGNLIKAFDKKVGKMTIDNYRDVKVQFRVKTEEPNKVETNYAQIGRMTIETGEVVYKDVDSNAGTWIDNEDDQDIEKVVIVRKETVYDLALRKFITGVNGEALTESREPKAVCTKLVNGGHDADYYHSKEPVLVAREDIVDYSLRIYNEGKEDAYASVVIDDVPEGLQMIAPGDGTNGTSKVNAEYGWVMYKKAGNEKASAEDTFTCDNVTYVKTDKPEEAVLIVTRYLAKENGEDNLMKAFDPAVGEMTKENYRDIKVQYKVITNTPNKLEINYAQIGEMTASSGEVVTDIDSTGGEWVDGEDDQDIEIVVIGKFDLALYKWVTQAIVIEDGKSKEYDSKHTEMDKSNTVNVSIPENKLDKVTVKFRYQLKVTNEGSIAGKALEVTDHIPAGLKFLPEDNTEFGWVAVDDKTIITDYLKDTELQPGESAEVTVVLTWINNSKNFGEKVNYAEISKDYNTKGWKDDDSKPGNFNEIPSEDDEDGDVVMLQIRTGIENIAYIVIAAVAMAIVAGGVVAIKKYVINK